MKILSTDNDAVIGSPLILNNLFPNYNQDLRSGSVTYMICPYAYGKHMLDMLLNHIYNLSVTRNLLLTWKIPYKFLLVVMIKKEKNIEYVYL